MSDLLVNINSAERRTILTVGADLGMKKLPVCLVFTYQSSVGSVYLPFVFSSRSKGIQARRQKNKGLHKREVTEKVQLNSLQLATRMTRSLSALKEKP